MNSIQYAVTQQASSCVLDRLRFVILLLVSLVTNLIQAVVSKKPPPLIKLCEALHGCD